MVTFALVRPNSLVAIAIARIRIAFDQRVGRHRHRAGIAFVREVGEINRHRRWRLESSAKMFREHLGLLRH